MNHLFIARHGDYGKNDRINGFGRHQMEVLGGAIKQILNGSSIYLFSSSAPRALDSSRVLAAQMALSPEFEQVPYLWSGDDAPSDSYYYDLRLDKLMQLVSERRNRADGLVMVTHLEVAERFPSHFVEEEFRQVNRIGKISKGKAVHIDLENRTYQILPQQNAR